MRYDSIQPHVAELAKLGPLPGSEEASVEFLQAFKKPLTSIETPVSPEDTRVLVSLLSPEEDSCFGLAWTLVHLIETCPDWSAHTTAILAGQEGEWADRLRER